MKNSRKLTASLAILAALLLLLIMNWMASAITSEPSFAGETSIARVLVIGLFQAIGLYLLLALRNEFKTLLVSSGTQLLLNLLLVVLAIAMLIQCIWFLLEGPATGRISVSNYYTLDVLLLSTVLVLVITLCAFGVALALSRSLSSQLLRVTGGCVAAGSLVMLVSIPISTVAFLAGLISLAIHFWRNKANIDIV
ncbi:hypothetical protein CWE13_08470 [Aliidiomarina shirensis]|uniref:Uncharacterized protein n=1 Tax=Aliidiomarina shirensis TaxID=1048642 RepID=A0A432WSX0_9GAMM|nr:hypothetical protein [Aliidiomarina shirensis]RUO36871.1 hypothetical protein CWE13_08470 [Aliidiomarina shirensis]